MYENATDLYTYTHTHTHIYIYILYLQLYQLYWIALIVFWWSLESSVFSIMLSTDMAILFFPFQFGVLLFCFHFLIAVDSTSNTMLNKSGRSEHPCFIYDLRENAFRFSLFSKKLDVGLSYMTFIMPKHVPPIPSFWRVLYWCWILSKDFFFPLNLLRWSIEMFFILQFVNVVYHTDLWILRNPCIPGINPTCSLCTILLSVLLNLVC